MLQVKLTLAKIGLRIYNLRDCLVKGHDSKAICAIKLSIKSACSTKSKDVYLSALAAAKFRRTECILLVRLVGSLHS